MVEPRWPRRRQSWFVLFGSAMERLSHSGCQSYADERSKSRTTVSCIYTSRTTTENARQGGTCHGSPQFGRRLASTTIWEKVWFPCFVLCRAQAKDPGRQTAIQGDDDRV